MTREALPHFPELTTRVQLRFADLNAAGHVANTAVPVLFDEARVRTLGYVTGPDGKPSAGLLAGTGLGPLIGQMTTEYVREIQFRGQDLEVRAWVSGIGGSRFALSAALLDGPDVAALSDCVVVVVDEQTGRPVRIPSSLRERLVHLSASAVPLRPRLTNLGPATS